MAEEKLDEVEQPLPCKRKPSADVEPLDQSNHFQKVKLDSSSDSAIINTQNGASSAATADNLSPLHNHSASIAAEDEEEEDYEDEDEDEDEEEDEEEVEREVDRKGKGIMTHDIKGKGKLIEESESDSSDDDGVGSDFDDDDESDLDEDPLAEVDLDNILPSRTRQRGRTPHRSGISLSDNAPKDQDN